MSLMKCSYLKRISGFRDYLRNIASVCIALLVLFEMAHSRSSSRSSDSTEIIHVFNL